MISVEIMKTTQRDFFRKPDPSSYKISHKVTEKKPIGAFNLKGLRDHTSFLADPQFKGSISPRFHNVNHKHVHKRTQTLPYRKPINAEVDKIPSYLRHKQATAEISPVSHEAMKSFKTATLAEPRFYIAKGVPRIPEPLNKSTRNNPGASHYDIKKIERGFNKITPGLSRGWK